MTEITNVRTIFEGWSKLSMATVRDRNGHEYERVIEDHGSASCVLAYDRARRVAMLVRQFRAPVCAASGHSDTLEAVAGLTDGEDPKTAAIREAFEEAGLRLRDLVPVSALWTMPGVSTERMYLYLACYSPPDIAGRGGGQDHEHEDITVVELPLRQLAEMADSGAIEDLKTFALVQTLRLREPDQFV